MTIPETAPNVEQAAEREILRATVTSKTPTLADFTRHADRFGPEQVCETAEVFLGARDLVRLQLHIDRHSLGGRKRTEDETRAVIAVLREEGLITPEIASELGISEKRVKNLAA